MRQAPATLWRLAGPLAALVLALGLTACANDPVNVVPGATREEMLARVGTPTAVYPMPGGGQRLQYSRAPAGVQVVNIDVDAAGRVISVVQELDENLFGRTIQPDVWREADVLRTYGRPAEISRVSAFDGTVWQWRYRQNNMPRFLYIYLDPQGVVRRYHVADDYSFERRWRW